MYIFVDEAGGFQPPSRSHLVSCVTALIVPEHFLRQLLRKVRRLIHPWRTNGAELKGSRLREAQVSQLLAAVRRFDVLLVAVAIDMGLHTNAGIIAHQQNQVNAIQRSVTEVMAPSVRARLESLATRMSSLSNQLYVQSVLLTKLVDAVIRSATLYYAQRLPRALGTFSWRLDAKDVGVTNAERLWRDVVGPFLQTESLSTPLAQLKGADYSSFGRFLGALPVPPQHLRPHVALPDERFEYMDMDAVLSDLKFCASHRVTGIQIVDMLASAIRRACNGDLGVKGWKGLGRLMPQPQTGSHAVRFLALEDVGDPEVPYARVIGEWDAETKRMLVA